MARKTLPKFPNPLCVFLATLSATGGRSLKLLCAAEIDCILEDDGEFVELKTQQFGRFGEQFPVRNKGFQFKGSFLCVYFLKWVPALFST